VGKPATHATTLQCDSCHTKTAWAPATFGHTGVTAGTCATCHNGTFASGKTTTHFITTRSCDACHNTTKWKPATSYTHVSTAWKPHNSSVTCASCHTTNNEVIAWPTAAYKPDCAGCHASKFKPGSHKKITSPSTNYTVAELKNCAGACHEYTNATLTTIKTSRTGHHKSTDGSF
jgi:hypothetical protein